nr:ABC transporter permease [Micromonospora sp. DSM 115978]
MSTLAGTGGLIRFILRRDRWLLPLWLLLVLIPTSVVSSLNELYPTAADRSEFAADMESNSALMVLYGRLYGDSLGELVAWRAGFFPVVFGLFIMLLVIRHTRAEEESGRRELLGSTAVGRHASLAAALAVAWGISLVICLLLTGSISGQDLPASGAFAIGASFVVSGGVFAAAAAVVAQLSSSTLRTRGIAVAIVVVAFLLRGIGDASANSDGSLGWLSWLSPFGWANQLRPFAGEQWWVLVLAAVAIAVLILAATALAGRRDLGSGLLSERSGPPAAAPALNSPLALAWRLQRGPLLGWIVLFVVFGVVFGSMGKTAGDALDDNSDLREAFARVGGEGALADAFLAAMMGLLGLAAAAYAISAALRLRAEESGLQVEQVLATGVGRLRWAVGHVLFALVGPAVVLLAAGLAMGLAYGLAAGEVGEQVPRLLGAALVQLPAVWVLAAVGIALFGLLPRLSAGGWVVLGLCALLGQFGALLQLSQGLLDVSPFTHLPKLPGASVSAAPLLLLVVLAAAITAVGLAGLRRRDMPVG